MDSDNTKLGPVTKGARIDALDILRGVAVLGILLMNIPEMGLRFEWGKPPLPVAANPDWIAYAIQTVGFSGTMRGLFTLLFGAGMVIMLRRADAEQEGVARQAYYTRCFALMVLGVINFAVFLWPGEILFSYGLCGLVLPLFRKAPPRMLVTAAVAMLAVMTIGIAAPALKNVEAMRTTEAAMAAKAAGKTLTKDQKAAIEKRETRIKERLGPEAREKERQTRTHMPDLLAWSLQEWSTFNLDLNEGAHIWQLESIAFMLLGVALLQTGVLTGERPASTYWTLLGIGLVVGLTVRGGVVYARWNTGYLANSFATPLEPLTYELGRLFMTLAWLGGLMLLIKARLLGGLAGVLSAVGRMALTNYILQSVVTSILFYGLGFYDKFGFAQLMGVAALIWVGQSLFSVLWLKVYEMGPAEWLLRSLTYGSWRSMRRDSPVLTPHPAE